MGMGVVDHLSHATEPRNIWLQDVGSPRLNQLPEAVAGILMLACHVVYSTDGHTVAGGGQLSTVAMQSKFNREPRTRGQVRRNTMDANEMRSTKVVPVVVRTLPPASASRTWWKQLPGVHQTGR